MSTHTIEQLEQALAARPVYVAFGPVFETSTKKDAHPVVGVAALRDAHARALAAGVPLVAIGGITRERARDIAGMVDVVAVISGLMPPVVLFEPPRPAGDVLREVAARARAFRDALAAEPSLVGTGR
jgi:thiamine-phosphate pyrophosphorylase